jgi:hypothetical protein
MHRSTIAQFYLRHLLQTQLNQDKTGTTLSFGESQQYYLTRHLLQCPGCLNNFVLWLCLSSLVCLSRFHHLQLALVVFVFAVMALEQLSRLKWIKHNN